MVWWQSGAQSAGLGGQGAGSGKEGDRVPSAGPEGQGAGSGGGGGTGCRVPGLRAKVPGQVEEGGGQGAGVCGKYDVENMITYWSILVPSSLNNAELVLFVAIPLKLSSFKWSGL